MTGECDGAARGTDYVRCALIAHEPTMRSEAMGRYMLLWLFGVPIPILVLIWAFGGLH